MPTLVFRPMMLMLMLFAITAKAATLNETSQVTQLTTEFMKELQAGNTPGAYAAVTKYLGVDAQQFEAYGRTAHDYMSKVNKEIGPAISFDLLANEAVKQHLLRQTYLLKYEEAALVWRFTFYNSGKGWRLVGVDYSTDVEQLYQLTP